MDICPSITTYTVVRHESRAGHRTVVVLQTVVGRRVARRPTTSLHVNTNLYIGGRFYRKTRKAPFLLREQDPAGHITEGRLSAKFTHTHRRVECSLSTIPV